MLCAKDLHRPALAGRAISNATKHAHRVAVGNGFKQIAIAELALCLHPDAAALFEARGPLGVIPGLFIM
jgi:hypothetical protein